MIVYIFEIVLIYLENLNLVNCSLQVYIHTDLTVIEKWCIQLLPS